VSGRISLVGRVAREEWRALARNRVSVVAGVILAALLVSAAVLGVEQRNAVETVRERYQASSDRQFDSQPDRHPHRMVHYGQFVFRPLSALAFFDRGVDSFTGHTVFLEGHRQNSANFSEARQSSLLLRFGELTPAFVLQTLAPLLVIFLAYGAVAGERERGTLRLMAAQGLSPERMLLGKLAAYGGVVGLILAPAALALLAAALVGWAPPGPALLLLLVYGLYLGIWAVGAVLISALARRSRDALIVLVSIWMVLVVLVPRTLPEIAARLQTPTKIETDIAIHEDLARIGDSHNPDDPYFSAFKAKTLAKYGVQRIEDLPVQWSGLVGMEGERLTSQLFDRHARQAFAREQAQNNLVRGFGVVSPVIALRQASMSLAGADIESHQDFLDQVERYRYAFVQALNRMQVEQIPNQNAGDDPRISADNWKRVPSFSYVTPDVLRLASGRVAANLAILTAWLVVLMALAAPVARRLRKDAL
jgi:ABC-2 type transport system permease protein